MARRLPPQSGSHPKVDPVYPWREDSQSFPIVAVRGVRPRHRPAAQRAAAERHRIPDRCGRLFLVRQSVSRIGRLSIASIFELERRRNLLAKKPPFRPTLLRHKSFQGTVLCPHRRSQRRVRRAHRRGYEPGRSHFELVQCDLGRQILVRTELGRRQRGPLSYEQAKTA